MSASDIPHERINVQGDESIVIYVGGYQVMVCDQRKGAMRRRRWIVMLHDEGPVLAWGNVWDGRIRHDGGLLTAKVRAAIITAEHILAAA